MRVLQPLVYRHDKLLQLVTNADWSFYLLKYSLKAECSGAIQWDVDSLRRFGLEAWSDSALHVVLPDLLWLRSRMSDLQCSAQSGTQQDTCQQRGL